MGQISKNIFESQVKQWVREVVMYVGTQQDRQDTLSVEGIAGSIDGCRFILRLADSMMESSLDEETFSSFNDIVTHEQVDYCCEVILHLAWSAFTSKKYIQSITQDISIGVVVPYVVSMEKGNKAVDIYCMLFHKLYEMSWLFSNKTNIYSKIIFVNDGESENERNLLENELRKLLHENTFLIKEIVSESIDSGSVFTPYMNTVFLEKGRNSIKGGAVEYGLEYALNSSCEYATYIDFDYTHRLSQVGNMLKLMLEDDSVGIVINSRRKENSFGYERGERNHSIGAYHSVVNDLLEMNLTDINTGFKLVNMSMYRQIYEQLQDLSLTFDTEIVFLMKKIGASVCENNAICIHDYVEGKHGVPRDYNVMIEQVKRNIAKHLHYT